jgi:hypothetical protein
MTLTTAFEVEVGAEYVLRVRDADDAAAGGYVVRVR